MSPMRSLLRLALLLVTLPLLAARAESPIIQQTGWAAWFNNAAINEHFGIVSDVQLRSRDEWAGPRNLLIRPGLSWYVKPGQTLSAGYAYIGTFNRDAEDAVEHRIWQQWVSSYRIERLNVSQRFRLEQRFIGRPGAPDVYSDRFRWFARAQLPLSASNGAFTQGAFLAFQNEAMVNLSGRDALNAPLFDQNRAYIAYGWRLNKTADIEIGYLNQWINGKNRDTVNHVLQVALYTFFR